MADNITFDDIRRNDEIKTYIERGDEVMCAIGYTEHSFAHAMRTADISRRILEELGYDDRYCELVQIASYMHDIGNAVNRVNHAQSGALMAFQILSRLGMDPSETIDIVTAIGHHDEATAYPVTPLAAALIIADKSDVRRSRVRSRDMDMFDIHDRVNYSVKKSELKLDIPNKHIVLRINIDTSLCAVMDYFEIFLDRMVLCKKSAAYLGLNFELMINNSQLL